MIRQGDCWDNSVCESFFHTIKMELIYSVQYAQRELVKQSIFEYIKTYYNRVRRHSTLGFIALFVFESKREMVTQVYL